MNAIMLSGLETKLGNLQIVIPGDEEVDDFRLSTEEKIEDHNSEEPTALDKVLEHPRMILGH